ncbi:hypothetical protein BT96DRAFT_919640 [Gymnopus androsaceus JB14]|uniref:Uncharacterized protein n=1 Tax=Gymnopus androsaceus JB14 TaxID=1447944 RepID=A0A6A4HR62_9AGAR|nr:hypothetical protein BT96DRAFT_919640 [Gymnopus androsaceus JB14]
MSGVVEERPHSLRSVPSNSSIASATSLSRRPRTRARSKTLTGNSSPRPDNIIISNNGNRWTCFKSPWWRKVGRNLPNAVSPQLLESEPIRVTKAAKQASQLPAISTFAPSAFSRVPLSQFDSDGVNVRDSMITQNSEVTQQTHASSSVYPPSTVSASTPSPRSPVDYGVQDQVPIVDEHHTFDEDDVSYRLRLLVNNNYFLPPAHSKPLPPVTPTQPKKPPTPTSGFLDIFRLGKSKSKPSTPTSEAGPPFNGLAPILRTTSDSTAVSGFPTQIQPPLPRASNPARAADRSGRVVVVREKMVDLATAAKQAELEMKKGRALRHEPVVDDVIDPTDAVDLPPPSEYPFTVQASALHGLGVSESVGAAALANHLPPRSPAVSCLDPDDDWRKALLKAAVGHSFDNLAAAAEAAKISKKIISSPIQLESNYASSSRSQGPTRPRGMSSPVSSSFSPIPVRTETPSAPLTPLMPPPRRQFINPVYSLSQTDLTETAAMPPSSPVAGPSVTRKRTSSPTLSDKYDTQAGKSNYALAMTPPPFRPGVRDSSESSFMHRRSSDRNTNRSRRGGSRAASSVASRSATPDSLSVYSAVTEDGPRASNESSRTASSMSADTTALSPTTSARNPSEAHIEEAYSPPEPTRSSQDSHNIDRAPSPPPPRASSSLSLEPLSPPPRMPRRRPPTAPADPTSESSKSIGSGSGSGSARAEIFEISAPEPTTPPFPSLMQRRHLDQNLRNLHIPTSIVPPEIHSAPPPSSPTSFFDMIQTQPNAMDFLEESSEESSDSGGDGESESDDDDRGTAEGRGGMSIAHSTHSSHSVYSTRSRVSNSSRTSFMRLGNHSTPYVSHSSLNNLREESPPPPPLPFGATDRKQPIGNIPQSTPFFTKKMRDEQGMLESTLDLHQYTHAQGSNLRDASSSPSVGGSRRPASSEASRRKSQESQRREQESAKLDGMLKLHMEAEKDRIKQIASSMKKAQTKTGGGPSASSSKTRGVR